MPAHAPAPQSAPSANAPSFCGLCSGPRRATAVLFDPLTQHQHALSLANTALAHSTLLDWLAQQNAHLVIPDTLLAAPCLNQDSQIPIAVWIAPSPLLEAIRLAAGLTARPPKQTAALLARWPSAPALRPFLRRLAAARPTDQLSLL
jgi:hypothetical protein